MSDLIRLGLAPVALQIDPFSDAILPENMMASPDPLDEARTQQEQPVLSIGKLGLVLIFIRETNAKSEFYEPKNDLTPWPETETC